MGWACSVDVTSSSRFRDMWHPPVRAHQEARPIPFTRNHTLIQLDVNVDHAGTEPVEAGLKTRLYSSSSAATGAPSVPLAFCSRYALMKGSRSPSSTRDGSPTS